MLCAHKIYGGNKFLIQLLVEFDDFVQLKCCKNQICNFKIFFYCTFIVLFLHLSLSFELKNINCYCIACFVVFYASNKISFNIIYDIFA